ncbi:plasmid stabilization protein [Arvimicrobium flavum]|uniref:plasmid stabilization protein n=1 Tax=Arvimicrobium flavum TaxID=3393320 RepID=UPI00237AC528|nr:plasmid stabilization protein [Mesorhizobium shangrilense]
MGDMLIRNVPEALKRQIEAAARRDGLSLSAKSIDLLRKSLSADAADEKPFVSAWDVLRPILHTAPDDPEAEEFARIMEEVEAEGKRDFGRPVPDPE